MAIRFACVECGTRLKAKKGTEGKRAKCPACGGIVRVPGPLALAEEPAAPASTPDGGRACPNCRNPLAPEAVLCTQCGFDLRTGETLGTPFGKRGVRRGVAYSVPVGKILIGAGVVAVLAGAWFLVIAPLFSKMTMAYAVGYVTNGDLNKAIEYLEKNRGKMTQEEQARANLLLAQLRLEMAKNKGKTLDMGKEIKQPDIKMQLKTKGFAGSALVVTVQITNKGEKPLHLKKDHFYVRGVSDIVLAAIHQDNTIDGMVVNPGETKSGQVAFRKVPDHPVRRGKSLGAVDGSNSYYYLSFNDGTNYVKRMLPF